MTASTHFRTNDSNTLLTIGVKDMGRRSFSIDVGGCFLGKGTTVAFFHRLGRIPSRRELLNIAASGPANTLEKSLRIHAGTKSGPVALLILTLPKAFCVSVTDMVKASGRGSCSWNIWWFLLNRGRSLLIVDRGGVGTGVG